MTSTRNTHTTKKDTQRRGRQCWHWSQGALGVYESIISTVSSPQLCAHTLRVDNWVSSAAVGHESAVECVDACTSHCSSLGDVQEGCVSPKADVSGLASLPTNGSLMTSVPSQEHQERRKKRTTSPDIKQPTAGLARWWLHSGRLDMQAAPRANINTVCGRCGATEVTTEASKSDCACGKRDSGGDSGCHESTHGSDWKHRGSKSQLKTSQRAIYLSLDPGKHKEEDERKVFWRKWIVEREEMDLKKCKIKQKNQRICLWQKCKRENGGAVDRKTKRENTTGAKLIQIAHTLPLQFFPVGGVCIWERIYVCVCCCKEKIVRNGTDSF